MNKFLSTLHRWLGFPLGLLFVVTFATGSISAIDELLKRVSITTENSQYVYQATSLTENAQALAVITEDKQEIRSIVLPTPESPYYRVNGRGESWTYPINQLEDVTNAKDGDNGFFKTNLQLHRNYLLGNDGLWGIGGKHYSAWVGLIAVMISLLGLWLWWPLRKGFKAKDLVPRGRKRKHFYYNHMTGGVVVLAVILLLAFSGASITYRAFTQQLLGVQQDNPADEQAVSIENNWLTWLETAYAQMPENAQLQQIRYPRLPKLQPNTAKQELSNDKKPNSQNIVPKQDIQKGTDLTSQLLEFRFHASGDWLGLPGSTVSIDKQRSVLVDTSLFSDLPLGEQVFAMLKPLHTGRELPAYYVGFLLILSLLGTVMVFSGVVSFIVKKRKKIKISRSLNVEPLTES